MNAESWIALGALIFTVTAASISATAIVLTRISKIKQELDEELDVIRMSGFEEYKTLRQEIGEVTHLSRNDFGESISAIREKTNQVEMWFRDKLEERSAMWDAKIDHNAERIRRIELFIAKTGFNNGG